MRERLCERISSYYAPVRDHSTHYDGETEAIYIALKQLSVHLSSFHQMVIFSDKLSALQSIAHAQYSDNILILQCSDLARLVPVSFRWIPAHCGISGDENADVLPKKGARVL